MRLKLLSYNLLAPLFVRVEGRAYSMFPHADAADLDASVRAARLHDWLRDAQADICCLQEVSYDAFELPSGDVSYRPAGWLRDLATETGRQLVPMPLKASQWRSQARRNLRAAGRDACVGLAMLLTDRATSVEVAASRKAMVVSFDIDGVAFGVTNVHLEGDPAKGADRADQLASALRRARAGAPRHVIVAGDWNSEVADDAPLAALLDRLRPPMSRTRLGATYAGTPGRPLAIDHVLFDRSLSLVHASVDITEADIAQGMPNARSPSDHAPLVVQLEVTGEPAVLQAPDSAMSSGGDSLEAEEAAKLAQSWRKLLAQAPPTPPTWPTSAELEALRAFKAEKKAFLDRLPSDVHRAYIKRLNW
jgi:endonuclease/exonuclease/phosphatase family metal-dependent hydrolase